MLGGLHGTSRRALALARSTNTNSSSIRSANHDRRRPLLQCCQGSGSSAGGTTKTATVQHCSSTSISSLQQQQQLSVWRRVWSEISKRPIEYATVPTVAALVGISTNWMAVKMLFYPIEYTGVDWYRSSPHSPIGLFGWQGLVPTKTEPMAARLVHVITRRLLSLDEAFGRLDAAALAALLAPAVEASIRADCGAAWAVLLRPVLPALLTRVVEALQREIGAVLDLEALVLAAFVRDKEVLTDLFQKVGRVELKFLVESGFGFGFVLGLLQMALWAVAPQPWTLPVAGAAVGYLTNWIAIKLLFEPADPVQVGPLVLQGLFESRQVQVSDEFGNFLDKRVLQSHSILAALTAGGDDGPFYAFLRRQLPFPVPAHILSAAVRAIHETSVHPEEHPELHAYVTRQLDISNTLAHRLKQLQPTEFEDLLHPVFQEDESVLIATGGAFGAVAGILQTRLGWGGTGAARRAALTIVGALAASAAFFYNNDVAEADDVVGKVEVLGDEDGDDVLVVPKLRRRNTVLQVKPLLGDYNGEAIGLRRRNTVLQVKPSA